MEYVTEGFLDGKQKPDEMAVTIYRGTCVVCKAPLELVHEETRGSMLDHWAEADGTAGTWIRCLRCNGRGEAEIFYRVTRIESLTGAQWDHRRADGAGDVARALFARMRDGASPSPKMMAMRVKHHR